MVRHLYLLGMLFLLLFSGGCSESQATSEDEEAPPTARGILKIDSADAEHLGIIVTPILHKEISDTKSAVGWLEAPQTAQHILRAPITGFVVASPERPFPKLG